MLGNEIHVSRKRVGVLGLLPVALCFITARQESCNDRRAVMSYEIAKSGTDFCNLRIRTIDNGIEHAGKKHALPIVRDEFRPGVSLTVARPPQLSTLKSSPWTSSETDPIITS
jgi:hypothetical protein